jgi:hypothetical protein
MMHSKIAETLEYKLSKDIKSVIQSAEVKSKAMSELKLPTEPMCVKTWEEMSISERVETLFPKNTPEELLADKVEIGNLTSSRKAEYDQILN